ncbi:hypothetical protein [Streptomyces griseorubiginosus]|uniref:hypothetical protein n=1 Tax=Streptomyces griseorubiginosus TaxID=67304 RepID=UPI00364B46E1
MENAFAARADRTYLYCQRDLLEGVHAAAPPDGGRIAAVGRASLRADLPNALERNRSLTVRVRQLERRLSESLGENAWTESGLGASADIDRLQRRITLLEQDLADMSGQLDERTEELDAA